MELPKNIADVARRLFAERFGLRDLTLVHLVTDKHPETGRPIYHVSAVPAGKFNEKAVSLSLDEAGKLVEGAPLLLFPFVPADPAAVEPVKVKIDPPVNDLRLGECDEFTETVTVTIPKAAALGKADIYFLADVTGSMGPVIAAVKAGAANILSSLAGLGDLQFGVGSYRDFPGAPASVFIHQQNVTATTADVQTAINTWSAAGGGDGPEGQFFALDQLAQPPGGSIGWRTGSKRIIVWFGDAPAHDPICKAISGLSYDITEATVTAKLVAESIEVLALGTTTGYPAALDDDPKATSSDYGVCGAPGGTSGQATRIAAATSGIYVTGVNAATIVNTIIAQLKALLTIKNVHLEAVGAIAPFVTSITPAAGYGPLDPDHEHVLKFVVSFHGGAVDCTTRDKVFTGALNVVADGVVVGRKPTKITVPACKYTYAVKFLCGTQSDCGCGCASVRPGVYATEINILNPKCKDAHVVKRFVPLVLGGAPAGREPKVVQARAVDRVTLPSGSATMDDCCRIAELLYGAEPASTMPLTVGFLEIISDQDLHVTAAYTATDLKGNGLSIDVQTVPGKLT